MHRKPLADIRKKIYFIIDISTFTMYVLQNKNSSLTERLVDDNASLSYQTFVSHKPARWLLMEVS